MNSGGCWIIAEVAQAHDGSLGAAHAYIDAAARAGADAVKFQTHIAAAESTPGEPWRVKFSKQDETRYGYWKRMEFTEPQWHGLKQHADEAGIAFLSSPFSMQAVELLTRVGVAAWKVASGEVSNSAMLRAMCAGGLPVILSSGMSPLSELDAAVDVVRKSGCDLTVLQCTSAYPCPPERVGLNMLAALRERYGCKVGLSDHTGAIWSPVAAAALGADVLEVHITFSRECFGPDVPASLTLEELRKMVEGVRAVEALRAAPVDKDGMALELEPLRKLFTKSAVATRDLPAGAVLVADMLAAKKPGSGIPADRIPDLLGRRLRCAVAADTLLSEDDLE